MFESGKSVTIYSALTGEKLCKIEAPQKWWSGLPIPLFFVWVSSHTGWKDPNMIEKWAWQQAYLIVAHLNDIGVTKQGDLLPSTFRCQCLICGQDTIVTVIRHWRWSSHIKLQGFECSNQECGMYEVLIPLVICSRIDEMPTEYLPSGVRLTRD